MSSSSSTPSTTPSTPTRRKNSIPRPPPSPLRPSSPSPSTPSTPHANAIPSSQPGVLLSPRRSAPATPPPKTRARDLLRKHYGLGVGPPPPLPGKPLDPMNLDSPAFEAKAYYEQLITTSSLPTLLKRENELLTELLSEIRELDSERQSLVYNHHHELIAASDTIAAMKTRAENLDADLDLLKVAFSEISRLGAEVAMEHNSSGELTNSET